MQEWKQIKDYPEYEVSNDGYVRRVLSPGKYNLLSRAPSGCFRYLMVSLSVKHVIHKKYIHRLVAQQFLDNPNPELYDSVGLKNKDGLDCRVENLYWTNQTELMALRKKQDKYAKGSEHHMSKLSEAEVIKARKLYDSGKKRVCDLARMYQMDDSTMDSIVKRNTWTHIE